MVLAQDTALLAAHVRDMTEESEPDDNQDAEDEEGQYLNDMQLNAKISLLSIFAKESLIARSLIINHRAQGAHNADANTTTTKTGQSCIDTDSPDVASLLLPVLQLRFSPYIVAMAFDVLVVAFNQSTRLQQQRLLDLGYLQLLCGRRCTKATLSNYGIQQLLRHLMVLSEDYFSATPNIGSTRTNSFSRASTTVNDHNTSSGRSQEAGQALPALPTGLSYRDLITRTDILARISASLCGYDMPKIIISLYSPKRADVNYLGLIESDSEHLRAVLQGHLIDPVSNLTSFLRSIMTAAHSNTGHGAGDAAKAIFNSHIAFRRLAMHVCSVAESSASDWGMAWCEEDDESHDTAKYVTSLHSH